MFQNHFSNFENRTTTKTFADLMVGLETDPHVNITFPNGEVLFEEPKEVCRGLKLTFTKPKSPEEFTLVLYLHFYIKFHNCTNLVNY